MGNGVNKESMRGTGAGYTRSLSMHKDEHVGTRNSGPQPLFSFTYGLLCR